MTVMTWGNSEGTKGRCDAKCHNATTEKCTCMCGGHYHGAGRNGTLAAKIERIGRDVIEAAQRRANAERLTISVPQNGKFVALTSSTKGLPLFEGS